LHEIVFQQVLKNKLLNIVILSLVAGIFYNSDTKAVKRFVRFFGKTLQAPWRVL